MSFAGDIARLAPQRLILDPIDGFIARRGVRERPRPISTLSAALTERLDEEGVPGEGAALDPVAELVLTRSPSGFLVFFDKQVDPTLGRRSSRLEGGRYTLRVTGRAYQPLRAAITLRPAPPPFNDLPDEAGAREAVPLILQPSFVHPGLVAAGGTQIGGAVTASEVAELDGLVITVTLPAPPGEAAETVLYALDRRGQWRLLLDDTALGFDDEDASEEDPGADPDGDLDEDPDGNPSADPDDVLTLDDPLPPTATVTVALRRGDAVLASGPVDVTRDAFTTVPTIAVPSA
ncbi:MAG: hypothetical protein AAF675_21470 [Pseudomonadota bacterium]